jgi:hypothetical protein
MEQTLRLANSTMAQRTTNQQRPVRIVNLEGEPLHERRIFGQDREYATPQEFAAQLQQGELLRSFRINPWG